MSAGCTLCLQSIVHVPGYADSTSLSDGLRAHEELEILSTSKDEAVATG